MDRLEIFADWLKSGFEAILGAILLSLPFWDKIMTDVTRGAQFVAALCGAIIGLHGVYRIWRKHSRKL